MTTQHTNTYPTWVTAFVSPEYQGEAARLAENLGLVPDRACPQDIDNKQPLPLLNTSFLTS